MAEDKITPNIEGFEDLFEELGIDAENKPSNKKEQKYKDIHKGHRNRVKFSADSDPDFISFNDHEVLEYILFTTIPRIDVNPIAHELMDSFGSLSSVLNASVSELVKVGGISETTARMLATVLPMARKAELSRIRANVEINTPANAASFLQPYFVNRNRELLYLLSLDINSRVISADLVARGDINCAPFNVKEIVSRACRNEACKIIVAHNHPSGNLKPSAEDVESTSKLIVALHCINIVFVDHMIFTASDYYSFFANKEIDHVYAYCDEVLHTKRLQEKREFLGSMRYLFDKSPSESDFGYSYKGLSVSPFIDDVINKKLKK